MKRSYSVSQNLAEELKEKTLKELKLGYINLSESMFDQAKMNFELVIEYDKECSDAYWGLMLVKLNCSNEDFLYSSPMTYRCALNLNECASAIQFATDTQKKQYLDLLERIIQISEGDNY